MPLVNTEIWITDGSLNRLTKVVNPYPLDKAGMILRYTKELDDFGTCAFRVSAVDALLTTYGDILQPHKNWVQITRNGATVWQGAIIENSQVTKDYIEVLAADPLWYLSKILIQRSSTDPLGNTNLYRIFNSGTMAAAVTALMNETITTYQSHGVHALSTMTLGTVENPNYPPNMVDATGKDLTGAWYFGNGTSAPLLQFDFHNVLYVLKTFGIYAYADFYLTTGLALNFVKFKGSNLTQSVTFNWNGPNNPASNIVDYNLPRLGQRMANDLYGIATDPNGVVLHYDGSDQASISTYGLLQNVAAYSDVKDQATLNARIAAEVPLISSPSANTVSITVNERGYPVGQYDVGDIVGIKITNRSVSFNDSRRIVGYTVRVHNTGRELTTVQTNVVLPWQYAALGSPQ